jgi:hypothetical protein
MLAEKPMTEGNGGKGVVVRRRESRLRDGEEESKKTPTAKALSFWKRPMQSNTSDIF